MTVARVKVSEHAGAPLVSLSGEIDLSNVDRVMAEIQSSVSNTARGLILDLSELAYVDSTGLRLLFRLARELHQRDQHLTLVVPPTAIIYRVLLRGGVLEALRVVPDLEAATSPDRHDRPEPNVARDDAP